MSRPLDTPDFNSLGHEEQRAIKIWLFLRSSHGRWFSVEEIAGSTGLAESTVRSALSRIFGLPPAMRPRFQRQTIEDENGRRTEYRFTRILDMVFEE